jgi:hypothetical protein
MCSVLSPEQASGWRRFMFSTSGRLNIRSRNGEGRREGGITNDPNRADDSQYILRLIGQVIHGLAWRR